MDKRPRASSDLADFTLSGQIIRDSRSLQLRFSLIQTKQKLTKTKIAYQKRKKIDSNSTHEGDEMIAF